MAVIDTLANRSRLIGLSMASALRRGDHKAVAKWAIAQADVDTSLAVEIDPALEDHDADAPAVVVDPDLFEPCADESAIYLVGGSPNNPAGVSFSYAQAKAWWAYVIASNLNLSGVRPTLLPGSAVLTEVGRKAAIALAKSATLAPEDFNPLGLAVIP